uniref:ACB domain-containing protein n=1 Tax=Parascaris equorum TaxID=6256 RepID=A0A914S4P1_PAREQ
MDGGWMVVMAIEVLPVKFCCQPAASPAWNSQKNSASRPPLPPTVSPSNDELLELYGLYKQATVGDNISTKPWLDLKGRAKWDAWESRKSEHTLRELDVDVRYASGKHQLQASCSLATEINYYRRAVDNLVDDYPKLDGGGWGTAGGDERNSFSIVALQLFGVT